MDEILPPFKKKTRLRYRVAVIGGGSWATAIVKILSANLEHIHWWVREEEIAEGVSKYGPVTQGDIAASGLHYLALGHTHAYSGLQRSGKTWWAYPGCTLGRGFDETGEKGAILGVLEGESCTLEFRPLSGRRYWDLEAEVTGAESLEQAVERCGTKQGNKGFFAMQAAIETVNVLKGLKKQKAR